jgi:CheY-like chemotaxis protein
MDSRILIADDIEDVVQTAAELLRLHGYDVKTACDGQQAVAIAREFHPDLVLLDINMPVMDGYTAAAILRRERGGSDRPVLVALSARTQPKDIERGREAGFDHHLCKPAFELCDSIDAFLRHISGACRSAHPVPRCRE